MPLLGGLFSRKQKPPRAGDDAADSLHSTAVSDYDPGPSPTSTSSYVHPTRFVPSQPNASSLLHPDSARNNYSHHAPPMTSTPTPSSSTNGGGKLRLFGRKKSLAAESAPVTPDPPRKSFQTAPRPQADRTSTDTEATDIRRLRPPPSRSAIFAAYGDPNSALSTRSLPNETINSTSSPFSLSPLQPSPTPPPKKSFFGWGKNHANAPAALSSNFDAGPLSNGFDPAGSPVSQDSTSFNLRSFRHVRPPSPTGSNSSFTPPVPRPRPRGESVNSDSAQRISVAAFREVQARRSQAGSPSPSFRSTSPAPGMPNGRSSPRPSRSASHIAQQQQQQRRRTSMALQLTSDSDASASSSEEESEDDTAYPGNRTKKALNTPGSAGRIKAKSEIGHGRHAPMVSSRSSDFPIQPRMPSSHVGHSTSPSPAPQRRLDENKKSLDVPRPQSTLNVYNSTLRPRASVSTSAITPSSAAKRASIVVATNAKMGNSSGTESRSSPVIPQLRAPQLPSHPSATSVSSASRQLPPRQTSSDSDSDSEDDAPLANLVGPRRPGSAMSSYSNLHARSTGNVTTRSVTNMPPKPLIDINELTGPKRSQTAPMEKNNAGFTGGQTLLAQKNAVSQQHSPSHLVDSPISMNTTLPWMTNQETAPLVSTFPPVKFASPMGSPVHEKTEFVGKIETPPPPMHQRTPSADMCDKVSSRRDSSPEMKRDPITNRLSRAVKNTLQSPPLDAASHDDTTWTGGIQQPVFTRDASPALGRASDASRTQDAVNGPTPRPRPARASMPFPRVASSSDHSPPDPELAQLLGTAVQFLTGEAPPQTKPTAPSTSSSSESSDDAEGPPAPVASKERIAPIPIKQRSPPPSFSVTSRPPLGKRDNANTDSSNRTSMYEQRPRSSTLQTSSTSSTSFASRKPSSGETSTSSSHASKPSTSSLSALTTLSTNNTATAQSRNERPGAVHPGMGARQRSSTMITGVPLSAQMNKQPPPAPAPEKPFAMRRNSPASSTGGSSSGRTPLTPRDGSDISDKKQEEAEKPRKHIKRRSVSFEDDVQDLKPPNRNYLKAQTPSRGNSEAGDADTDEVEERRRERRRSEAKASIELGNVVNGRGPVLDDDDEDMPVNRIPNARMSTLNPMMAMGNPMTMQMGQMGFPASPGQGMWPGNMQMLSPAQFMVPPPADPNFLAAHQQAMAYAKQAYQMAVAQQAMAAAADEWERGSTFGGGSVYGGGGGGSVYGGGGGSVYGGSQAPSMMGSPFAMMGGMNMMPGAWSSAASMYGGGGARSAYGGSQLGVPDMSSSRSEYGGGRRGGGNWSSSRSSYGESFGPEQTTRRGGASGGKRGTQGAGRESGYFPPMPLISPGQLNTGRNSPELRGRPKLGQSPNRKAPPPSSWKAS